MTQRQWVYDERQRLLLEVSAKVLPVFLQRGWSLVRSAANAAIDVAEAVHDARKLKHSTKSDAKE